MICWVAERALAARNVSRAIVATDDARVMDAMKSAGYEAVMTSANHRSGTDRIAEVALSLAADADIIVNVQGDEPLISPITIERAVEALGEEGKWGKGEGVSEGIGIVTTWEPIESAADVLNPDVVKIVVDDSERAIYFSRSPVPYPRDAARRHGSIEAAILAEPALLTNFRKHTGLYVYRRDVLLEFAKWPQSELERLESLEQLRALEHGVKIKAIKASTPSIGVDTIEDLERVRQLVTSSEFRSAVPSSEFRVSSSLG
jgi:3-deoxy-manno-octulosonate cytidylyltransferase (CMP-KDO synthetase)